jgi:NAD-dependent dihydropyrimidine dehydrogenase PreA subunit
MLREKIANSLVPAGLLLRGGFAPRPEDGLPAVSGGRPAGTLLLVGNAGSALWRAFAGSPEIGDGKPHPLNRWTRRLVDGAATGVGGRALYPFDADPPWPFQRWARRAEPVHPSPIGLLIHPEYGLWHAYRAAVLLAERLDIPPPPPIRRPCDNCAEKPCLSSCPVGAFTAAGYAVAACLNHLEVPAGEDCVGQGCRARRACPVGAAYRQEPAQADFHMRAFVAAARARGG